MNDEAATHFASIIDNMELGLTWLRDNLGTKKKFMFPDSSENFARIVFIVVRKVFNLILIKVRNSYSYFFEYFLDFLHFSDLDLLC
jgi:hypothetical protein